ncbi:MAG: hypothetical protein A2940_00405 [Candidatus Wildermuthbacteria bacterium RIFCSPLOWO2_01_FULL_48_29]|uniref:Uncharacterized protein n=1 Tax=Candidatus Wildermuthbacteria bacterium RIFCSPLOWO2_01_FULL_48_29 TaxID=1802462 RepID=A0A1G2RMM8_9BACT|nr:MAG: hypothetical protein A2940_00405 [Candidatus Wildermuthbacteria bacterium RIFCSPLOWO2_01_FULL_48_29]
MNAKNIFIILVVLFVIGAVALALTGFQQQATTPPEENSDQSSTGRLPGVPAPTVYNLSGTLLTTRGDLITFGVQVERAEDDRKLIEEKVVRVSSTTQIVRFETVTNPETGRPRVQEVPIALSFLRPGDRIQVISNRDILAQAEIQATKIRFLGRD